MLLDISGTSCLSLTRSHQVFISVVHVLPCYFNFGDTLRKNVLVQDQFDGGEDVERVVHHQGLFYVPEIIKTELTNEKTRELVTEKYYVNLQLLPIPTYYQ